MLLKKKNGYKIQIFNTFSFLHNKITIKTSNKKSILKKSIKQVKVSSFRHPSHIRI